MWGDESVSLDPAGWQLLIHSGTKSNSQEWLSESFAHLPVLIPVLQQYGHGGFMNGTRGAGTVGKSSLAHCFCQGSVMGLPSHPATSKKAVLFCRASLCALRSGCSCAHWARWLLPFVPTWHVLCCGHAPSHHPAGNVLSCTRGRSLPPFLHISTSFGEVCLRRSKQDSTAGNSLLGDNQSPSRSTLWAQLHNSLCSLEGTAPYVQFPSYI